MSRSQCSPVHKSQAVVAVPNILVRVHIARRLQPPDSAVHALRGRRDSLNRSCTVQGSPCRRSRACVFLYGCCLGFVRVTKVIAGSVLAQLTDLGASLTVRVRSCIGLLFGSCLKSCFFNELVNKK